MSVESRIHDSLMRFPLVKKIAKRGYQVANVMLSRPKKSEGKIIRVTPDDEYEYLFGYYDKSPWDASGRHMLCLRVKDASREVAPKSIAEIVLIDTENNNSVKVIGKTHTWNVQQGCMAGWLGPNFDKEIFYNDCRHGKYCGIILNIETGEEKNLDMPVYTVSNDGKIALSLDFSRLHRLRPGYGYSNIKDRTIGQKIPDGPCVWKIDVKTGKSEPILSYEALYNFEHRKDMENADHKVNHLMLSPNGKRFMVIHRWLKGGKKISRLLTCDINGKNLYNLSDEDMVSHCYWKNNREILAYCKHDGENGYYLFKDQAKDCDRKWNFLTSDGHPSYSPNGKLVVTDTYPNRKRICTIRVLSDTVSTVVAKVYAPFKYDNDTRCDLHPRWSRDGKKICFDGCFEGKREVYTLELPKNILNVTKCNTAISGKIKIIYLMTSPRKSGPTEQTLNIIKNLDHDKFNPILVTIYEEGIDSRINEYLPFVSEHHTVLVGKKAIILKKNDKMKKFLSECKPDIVHSVGVFPDYLISTIGFQNHIFTLRNYAYEDYPAKFGKIRGKILAKMQISAINNTRNVVACSKSLQKIYKEKLNIEVDCIQNGVDVSKFKPVDKEMKIKIRKKLGLNEGDFVWIYSGQFIDRKNIPFMIEGFLKARGESDKLLLLGNGEQFDSIRAHYDNRQNLIFTGAVDNVNEYLSASDVYISASRSEGLPNGVLEAMAIGLPVLLSDIPQHKELIPKNLENGGLTFKLGDEEDYLAKINQIHECNLIKVGKAARKEIENNFSDTVMSEKYQKRYSIIGNNDNE